MSSKKKYIILTLLVLMFPFFLIRILNNFKIKEFKQKLEIVSEDLKKDFLDQKSIILNETIKSKKVKDLFINEFNEINAFSQFDTVFNFFYITSSVKFNAYDKRYLFCLLDKSKSSIENTFNTEKIKLRNNNLKKKHGKGYTKWYPDFENYLDGIDSVSCSEFFTYSTVNFDESNWNDFSDFLTHYSKTIKEAKRKNNSKKNKFKSYKNKKKKQLKYKFHNNYETELTEKKDNFLIKNKEIFKHKSSLKGEIIFHFESVTFNQTKFDNVSEKIFEDQWKTNSLRTGSMPYASCYGSSNYGSSKIEVKNSGNDVVILVKNSNKKVIRHAYIQGNNNFSINLPNGRYSVFFYNGKGWNPNKKMKKTYCGIPRGGFVSNESFTKDENFYISNQILTYTLERSSYGNFNPKGSSINEAF